MAWCVKRQNIAGLFQQTFYFCSADSFSWWCFASCWIIAKIWITSKYLYGKVILWNGTSGYLPLLCHIRQCVDFFPPCKAWFNPASRSYMAPYLHTTFSMYAKCAIRAHIHRIRLKSLSWNFLLIVLIRSKVVSLERRLIQKLVIEKYCLVSVYVPPHKLTITNILFVTSIHQVTNPQIFYPNIYLLFFLD